jgi:hypothetical protein
MGGERGVKGDGSLRRHRRSGAVMDGGQSHQPDPAAAVSMVVPAEELLTVSASIFDRAEAIGEVGVGTSKF